MNSKKIFNSSLISFIPIPRIINNLFLIISGLQLVALSLLLSKRSIQRDILVYDILEIIVGASNITFLSNSEVFFSFLLIAYGTINLILIVIAEILYHSGIDNKLFQKCWKLYTASNFYVFGLPSFNLISTSIMKMSIGTQNENYSLLVGVAAVSILCNFIATFFQITIMIPLKTPDTLSRSGKTFEIIFCLQRYLIATGIIIMNSETEPSKSMISWFHLINLIFAVGLMYFLTKTRVFFHSETNSAFLFFQAAAFSASLGGLFARFFCEEKLTSSTRLIFFSFLFTPILYKIADSSSKSFITSQITKSSNKTSRPSISAHFAVLLSTINRNIMFDSDSLLYPKDKLEIIATQQYLKLYAIHADKNDLESCLRNYLKQAKLHTSAGSYESLLYCFLTYSVLKDYFTAFYEANDIFNSIEANFNVKLGALYIIKNIKMDQKILVEQNEKPEIIKSLKLLEKYEIILKKISDHLLNHITMYRIMISQSPCLENLFKFTQRTQKSFTFVEESFSKITKSELEHCPKILKFYSLFLLITGTNKERAAELYNQQNQIQIKHIENVSRDAAHQAITQSNSVCCSINLNKINFGQRMAVSPSFVKLNGLTSSEYSNKKIDVIFPKSLRVQFEELVQEKLRSGIGLHKLTHFKTLLGHKEGHLVPVSSYFILNPVINEDLSLMIIFTPLEEKKNFILFSPEGDFEGSSFLPEDFAMKNHELQKFFKLLLSNLKLRNTSQNLSANFVEFREEKTSSIFRASIVTDKDFKYAGLLVEINKSRIRSSSSKSKFQNHSRKDQSKLSSDYIPDLDDIPDEPTAEYPNQNLSSCFQNQESLDAVKEECVNIEVKAEKKSDLEIQDQKNDDQSSRLDSELYHEDADDKIIQVSKSAISKSSDHVYLRIRANMEELIPKLSIFSFIERHFIFGFYMCFLVSFLTASYLGYANATNAVQEVIKSIELMKNLYGRSSTLTDLFRTSLNDYLFKNFYDQSLNSTKKILESNLLNSYIRINRMISYQNEVKRLLNELKDKRMVNHFYEKNIRVYYDEFDQVPNTEFYHFENSFHSYDIIIQASDYLARRLNTNDSSLAYYRDFIATLALNDLFITSRAYPKMVQQSMENILIEISEQITTIFNISLGFLGLFIAVVIYFMSQTYAHTARLLNIMLNNDPFDLLQALKLLEQFQKKISLELDDDTHLKSQNDLIIESKTYNREGDSKRLFFNFFVANTSLLIGLLTPNILLIILNMSYSSKINSVASEGALGVRNLNEIGLGALEIISDAALYDFIPHIKSKNKNISEIYEQEIKDLDLVASSSKNLNNVIVKDLSINICPYFIPSTVRPSCASLNDGQAERGIKSSIFFLKDFLTSFKQWGDSIPDSFNKRFILNNVTARVDIDYLCYNAINPAIRVFTNDITADLMSNLNERVNEVIGLFDVAISVNIFIMIAKFIWVYVIMANNRKVLLNFFQKVPLEILRTNRSLKHYLVKESKDFYILLKDIDQKYKLSRKKKKNSV